MDDPKFPQPVSVSELRSDLRRILETAHYFHQRYVIMRNGDMMAVLLAVEDFRALVGAPGKPGEVERHAD
jgi:hypothetical protein